MRNKIIMIILVIACLIPSAVAYASYNKIQNAPVDEKTAVSISIDDVNGKNFSYTKESDGDTADRLIKYFLSVKTNASPIASLPAALREELFFKVTLASNVREETYEFYFSPDPATNYFRSPDGVSYKMSEDDAELFITTEYAESLYETSAMPELTLSNTYTVTPDNAIWQYKNYTGSYVDSDVSGLIADVIERYELEGGLNLSFDMEPDFCSVHVTDADGVVLYDDMYSNMTDFRMDSVGQVTINVTAKWYEDPARSFCGELDYSFASYVTAPAEFYIGMSSIDAGKFVAITALNVTKPENVKFTSTLGSDYQPTFYLDGEYAVALLPIDPETPSGLYSLTFAYGAATQDITLSVSNSGIKASYYSIPESVVSSTRTTATLSQFESAVAEIAQKASSTRYFSGYFEQGITGTYQLMRGFGRDIYLNGSQTVTYRNNGIDYSADANVDVVACNAGEVVYSGRLDYTGNIVVIEHGYGLKTWYYNLDSVSVSVGDKVERGAVVGKTGSTGFTGITGAHISMSIGSVFVSPYDTWQDSSIAGKVIIPLIDE